MTKKMMKMKKKKRKKRKRLRKKSLKWVMGMDSNSN